MEGGVTSTSFGADEAGGTSPAGIGIAVWVAIGSGEVGVEITAA